MNKTAPIIPRSRPPEHVPAWRRALAEAVTEPAELLALLKLPPTLLDAPECAAAGRQFPLRVPRGFIARMQPGDPRDPLLLQVLPRAEEVQLPAGYSADPLAEADAMVAPGLLHKYPGRVLLTLTGACGIHCRYCFRRHYPYAEANPSGQHWQAVLDYIKGDDSIREVIFSGGDPLSESDARLARQIADLQAIPHLTRLRLHSRLPVVLPERLTGALLETLTSSRLTAVLVIHANHPNEIDAAVRAALQQARLADITLLNQAVLMRGINDDATTLARLSEDLFQAGVLPYYLHQLDKVQGAAHFEVSDDRARQLWQELQSQLPGYLLPRLVRELAGEPAKTPL